MSDECANPLLLGWIKEWLDQARERNSKGFTVYKKAYDSMKACPLQFDHPSEAQQLHGLGPKLCDRLTDKLKAHCSANGLPIPELPRRGSKRTSDNEGAEITQPTKKPRKAKPYVPTLRSGAYALVLALATLDEDASQGLTKSETIELAQPNCDSSFTAPSDPTKFYTAWNSMKTLVGKDLVYEHGRPLRRYMLTEDGWEVAKRIQGVENRSIRNLVTATGSSKDKEDIASTSSRRREDPSKNSASTCNVATIEVANLLSSPERSMPRRVRRTPDPEDIPTHHREDEESQAESLPSFTPFTLPAGTFTVHLVLDSREIRTTTDRDYISSELVKRGIVPTIRALPLGDALWIARPNVEQEGNLKNSNPGDEGEGSNEIVLDYIIERKRLDDLIGSIKDGRFREQKFRLRRSGLKHVTYVIEDFSVSAEKMDKFGESVASAVAGTQVVNGYFVKHTAKLDDTIRYLARMTKLLQNMYDGKDLHLIPTNALTSRTYLPLLTHLRTTQPDHGHYITFNAFSSLCSKSDTMSLRDVFLKMLMCTRGVTGERALEIQRRWKTPKEFVEAYKKVDGQKEKEAMISEKLGGLVPRKKVAKGLSAKIAEVWG